MKYKRIFTIVIDSLGVGEMHDAADYNDLGADTLGHIAREMKVLNIPNLIDLGLANLHPVRELTPVENPKGYFAYMNEQSRGKDTLTGHWEMMGVNTLEPFQVFTDTGFPDELIKILEEKTGRKIIGNKSSSGTVIIDELAMREINNGELIVYTSADSVLQICGNEETMGVKKLYEYCEIAREVCMREDFKVARVIARPYVGSKVGEFKRTSNRHDYALSPPHATYLNALQDKGLDVISVGKISDIFNGCGINESNKSKSSVHGMQQTIELLDKDFTGFCFTNLVDFDALWGHRRDPIGYGKELEAFDVLLGEFLEKMHDDDLVIITSDHGNDPVHHGTDHTREKAIFLAYSKNLKGSGRLDATTTFAVIGATVIDNFNVEKPEQCIGYSLLDDLK